MTRKSISAAQAERLLRLGVRRAGTGWQVSEVRGVGGRRRGKGSHKMIGLYDQSGSVLAWTTIPQHPGYLSPVVARQIEATFAPYLGNGWMSE